jgi:hypothetical protein
MARPALATTALATTARVVVVGRVIAGLPSRRLTVLAISVVVAAS